ncbi:APC family permease [Raineya orbicola]|uniref:Amino acid transporter n=1 Tax=Raineya orbicola TaxID=2016530 RepID=A0A2N3IK19_9BACT|nr:amino acid permease [Raineya orbicola]PKQ70680.1 Amino acid transporter [Raineya orbicola]
MSFRKEIRLFDAVMLVAGTMIGSGIFIVSSDIAQKTQSVFGLLIVWLITGLITMAGALSYGELAAMMPQAGGQYVFLRKTYNSLIAFLYGWTVLAVIQTGTIAAVAVAFANFTGNLFPFISKNNKIIEIGNFSIATNQILAIIVIWLLTFINTKGVKYGTLIQNLFGSTKIIALALLLLIIFVFGRNVVAISENFGKYWALPENVSLAEYLPLFAVAMIGSLFSSDAWNNISFAGDEIVNAEKTIPRSLAIGTGLVTLIYLLTNVAYLIALPFPQIQSNELVATAAASQVLGQIGLLLVSVLIMISTFGSDNGCILSGARVYYAMAKDGVFFSALGKLNKNDVPQNALVVQAIWASVLCLSGAYSDLLGYVMFAVMLFYFLTILAVFILRKKMPDLPRPYKAVAYPFLPALYLVLITIISIIWLIYEPYTRYGFLIVLSGLPVYVWLKKKRQD